MNPHDYSSAIIHDSDPHSKGLVDNFAEAFEGVKGTACTAQISKDDTNRNPCSLSWAWGLTLVFTKPASLREQMVLHTTAHAILRDVRAHQQTTQAGHLVQSRPAGNGLGR